MLQLLQGRENTENFKSAAAAPDHAPAAALLLLLLLLPHSLLPPPVTPFASPRVQNQWQPVESESGRPHRIWSEWTYYRPGHRKRNYRSSAATIIATAPSPAAPLPGLAYEDKKLTNIRKLIAKPCTSPSAPSAQLTHHFLPM